MSNKEIFDKNERIKPMVKKEFDYEKHYPKLMENYCIALHEIEQQQARIAELEEELNPGAVECDCCEFIESVGVWVADCQCGNSDDKGRAMSWCDQANRYERVVKKDRG